MRTRWAGFAACATALALVASSAFAGELTVGGDGSGYNNPDLVDDPSQGCAKCQPNIPDEPYDPFYDLDWSLGLRGAVTDDGTERTYQLIALPSATLKHETIRGGYDLGLSGELSYEVEGQQPRIDSITATAGGTYALDSVTRLEGRVTADISQDAPSDNVVFAPVVIAGDAEASITRAIGTFDATLKGSVGRTVHGETMYDDDSTLDNSYQNLTRYGAGSRLGMHLTPGLTAFVDGTAEAEQYDQVSPSLMVMLDNLTYAVRGGLNAKLGETLELEASLGLGYRDFTDATLTDFSALLYDARAVFKPDETLSFTAALTSTIESPGSTSGALAKVSYEASGEVSYLVNPWLRLRADASWSKARYEGLGTEEAGWGFGAGLDYLLNEHTDLTADYSFKRTETPPDPAEDEHKVTIGVNLHR